MIAESINIGHHARVPAQLIAEVTKPRALQILNHLLTLCNPQKPEVWIDQQLVGKKLGVHRETAGYWIRYLERLGRLVCLGFHHDGRRKRYLINLAAQQESSLEKTSPANPHKATSNDFAGRPPAKQLDDLQRFHWTINREEKTEIKEQTVVEISKRVFSSNEKIALKQKLKTIGLHKHSIEKLVDKFSIERINAQINHLDALIKRGEVISKPAAWLFAAIKNDYILPVDTAKSKLDEQNAEASREAALLAQTARHALVEGNMREAKRAAEKSLEKAKNSLAQEVLRDVKTSLERAERIKRAERELTAETKQNIRLRAEQEQSSQCRKWFKSEDEMRASKLFRGAVDALFNQRLLEAV
jgi:hypothetical protein